MTAAAAGDATAGLWQSRQAAAEWRPVKKLRSVRALRWV
jgi:hypothetical protein